MPEINGITQKEHVERKTEVREWNSGNFKPFKSRESGSILWKVVDTFSAFFHFLFSCGMLK